MVQVKHGITSPLVRTSRQLTVSKKTFKDAEKTAVTRKEPMKRRIIFLIQCSGLTATVANNLDSLSSSDRVVPSNAQDGAIR